MRCSMAELQGSWAEGTAQRDCLQNLAVDIQCDIILYIAVSHTTLLPRDCVLQAWDEVLAMPSINMQELLNIKSRHLACITHVTMLPA